MRGGREEVRGGREKGETHNSSIKRRIVLIVLCYSTMLLLPVRM